MKYLFYFEDSISAFLFFLKENCLFKIRFLKNNRFLIWVAFGGKSL